MLLQKEHKHETSTFHQFYSLLLSLPCQHSLNHLSLLLYFTVSFSLSLYLKATFIPYSLKNSTPQSQKRKMSPASGSSRWSPTTEQLMILEELYRSGIKTPTASQIQHITTHLSFYGRIEGKNVFYWFQNHKARDRQKLRRKLNKQLQLQQQLQLQHCHQQNNISHPFLSGFGSLPDSSTQKFSLCNSAGLFPQGTAAGTSEQATDCKWRVHNPQSLKENTEMTLCNYNWRLVDCDDHQACSCCIRPLKTLDLFPITAASLKEESSTSTKQLFHSMSTN